MSCAILRRRSVTRWTSILYWYLFWSLILQSSDIVMHHHHKSWAQCPLTSDACFTIFCQLLRSSAKWLSSCRFSPHHSTISSVYSLCGWPLLFLPSIFQKSSIFSFLSSDIRHMCPKSCSYLSITVCSRLCSWPIFSYNSLSSLLSFMNPPSSSPYLT